MDTYTAYKVIVDDNEFRTFHFSSEQQEEAEDYAQASAQSGTAEKVDCYYRESTEHEWKLYRTLTGEIDNTYYFTQFQSDYEHFDFENYDGEVGFPDGQFVGNGLDFECAAYLAQCWRDGNKDGAAELIDSLADDDLKERIANIFNRCLNIEVPSGLMFVWETADFNY